VCLPCANIPHRETTRKIEAGRKQDEKRKFIETADGLNSAESLRIEMVSVRTVRELGEKGEKGRSCLLERRKTCVVRP